MNICDSPESLQDICVKFISLNIKSVFSTIEDLNGNTMKYVFKDSAIYLPSCVSEQLFEALDKTVMTDQLLAIFDSSTTPLREVCIQNASKLTAKGLHILKSHRITDLTVLKLSQVSVNYMIGCLGVWTIRNLCRLNVSQSTFGTNEKVCIVIALSKLKSLRHLDVSFTEMNNQGLQIIADDMPCLESLNIAGTMVSDILPLKRCSDRLKYLNLFSLKLLRSNDHYPALSQLKNLHYLDISDDSNDPYVRIENPECRYDDMFEALENMPHLVSLDLSGRRGIMKDKLLKCVSQHKKLKFLGLMENELCQLDCFCRENDPTFNSDLTVSGFATETQVLESIRRYLSRKVYMQKALCYLYADIQNLISVRLDIIELVLNGMNAYADTLGIQMAGTACLYNLSKGNLSQEIHPKWLKKIVDCTLTSMENFPKQLQLQKNALLTLCSDRMLQDVSFNRYHCAELVMNSLMSFDDPAMNRMSVAICSILAAKISTAETSNLGAKSDYMIRLLDIVKSKAEAGVVDVLMRFTLSALWNLTDESPRTCGVFLSLGGLDLFLFVLERFVGESSVETKVLGLMNNIAEVSHLREYLMKDVFITALKSLLQSYHIDVSYFAAGIVAHLASEGEEFWILWNQNNWSVMIKELGAAVLRWDVPSTEMVAYRSFNPFYPLFYCFQSYQVQLWAAWAIHHVCLKNPKRYCQMIVEEGGVEIIRTLLSNPTFSSTVAHLCFEILHFVQQEFPHISVPTHRHHIQHR